jgi:O-antigen/teichoic acid export membrane protein
MRELWRLIIQTGGARAYSLVTGVLVVALTARYLGPEGRGILAALTTWATGFATLFHLSLGQVALHKAGGSLDRRWLDESFAALVFWCGAATVMAWGSAVLLHLLTAGRIFNGIDPWLLAIGLLLVPLIIWEQYSSALLMALNRLDVANTYQVVGRTVTLATAAISLFFIGPWVACIVAANFLGQGVVALGGIRTMQQNYAGSIAVKYLPDLLRNGLKLHFNAIGTFLFASFDILIVNHFAGPIETGYYQLGVQLLAVLMVLPQAASSALYAKVAAIGPDRAWLIQRSIVIQTMFLVMVIIFIAAWLAEDIVLLIAGAEFAPTVDVFRWQLLSVLGMSLAAIMAPQWIGRGLFRTASALTLLFGTINISLSLWLVPEHGMFGAAWASALTFVVAIFTNGTFAWWCNRRAVAQIEVAQSL